MIFNLTKKPFYAFNNEQRLATKAECILHRACRSIEEFDEWVERVGIDNISKVIVENNVNKLVFNNDVLNRVSCPVVTLDVEIDELGNAEFVEYIPDEV